MRNLLLMLGTIALFGTISVHTTFAMDLDQVVNEIGYFAVDSQAVLGASAQTGSGTLVSTEQQNPTVILSQGNKILILRDLRDSQKGKPVMVRSVRYGESANADVKRLQIFLIAKGYLTANPTGNFLTQTKLALKKFQEDQAILGGDGTISGPKTNESINTITIDETGGDPTVR